MNILFLWESEHESFNLMANKLDGAFLLFGRQLGWLTEFQSLAHIRSLLLFQVLEKNSIVLIIVFTIRFCTLAILITDNQNLISRSAGSTCQLI